MSETLGMTTEQLRSIPVLRGFSAEQLAALAKLFDEVDARTGDVLFDVDDPAHAFYILSSGEISMQQPGEPAMALHPPAVIGELGALTGETRNCKVLVGDGAQLWKLDGDALRTFFGENPEIGLRFQSNLLELVADKINRDQRRLADMRDNLIRTQKAMKRMRTFLLESQDTVVSRPMHEILDGLIRQNRRVNYRVEPPGVLSSLMRLDDKREAPVVQISRTHVSVRLDGQRPGTGERISGVLKLSGPEIPISGVVLRNIGDRVDLELDLLIEEYAAILEGYLTRVQMLDVLV